MNARWAVASVLGLVSAASCVPANRESERPKLPDKPPEWATPQRLLVASQLPEDANQDGYYETIPITVYVFNERYPLSLPAAGSFEFVASVPGGAELAKWTISEGEAASAMRKMRPGPGFQFRLNIDDAGVSVRTDTAAELTAIFTPREGSPIRAAAATTFRLGRVAGDRRP